MMANAEELDKNLSNINNPEILHRRSYRQNPPKIETFGNGIIALVQTPEIILWQAFPFAVVKITCPVYYNLHDTTLEKQGSDKILQYESSDCVIHTHIKKQF